MVFMLKYSPLYPTSELRVAYTSGHTSAPSSCLVMFAISASTSSVSATHAVTNNRMTTHLHRGTSHPRASKHGSSGGLQQGWHRRHHRRVVTSFAPRRDWLVWWQDGKHHVTSYIYTVTARPFIQIYCSYYSPLIATCIYLHYL